MKGGIIQGYPRPSSKRGGEGIHTCNHEVTGDPSLRGVSRQAVRSTQKAHHIQAFSVLGFQRNRLPFLLLGVGKVGNLAKAALVQVIQINLPCLFLRLQHL